jgi:hypothetical protein
MGVTMTATAARDREVAEALRLLREARERAAQGADLLIEAGMLFEGRMGHVHAGYLDGLIAYVEAVEAGRAVDVPAGPGTVGE